MLVLVSAVMLSPIVTTMGLKSFASSDFGTSELIMDGLTGSDENHKKCLNEKVEGK